MSSFDVDASEVDDLVADVTRAGVELVDLDPANQAAAAEVLGRVKVPIRTGALSTTVDAVPDALGFTLTAGGPPAPYGPRVHAYRPFLTDALTESTPDVLDDYVDHVIDTLNTIGT